MAKRIVESNVKSSDNKNNKGKPIKKKRHGCRNCLISLLVFIVVLGAGAYFAGDYFAKKYLDMGLADCFGVLGDLRSASADKIVTNGYSDSDYAQFDISLKNQLFLKSDVDFGVDDLISSIINDDGESADPIDNYLARTASELKAGINADGLVNVVGDLFVRENMDMQRLLAYDESKHDTDYVLKVTDKMLAAAVNASMDTVGEAFDITSRLDEFGIKKLSDVAVFEQMIFGETRGLLYGVDASVKTVTATVSLNARKAVNNYIKESTGFSLSWITAMFLPKRLYATVVVPVETGAAIEHNLYINGMSGKKMDRAYKLIEGISSIAGSKLDIKGKIASVVADTVGGVIETVNDVFPLDEAKNGTVYFDAFETVIELGGLNKNGDGTLKPEDKQLHAPDVISTLAGVVASEADDAIMPEYDFMHQYREDATDKVVYVKTPPASGYTWIDYREEFMSELARKYMLDLRKDDDDPTNDVTFEYLMELFGLGGDGSGGDKKDELLELFDASKLNSLLKEDEMRVRINSRMLGAILSTQIDKMTGEGSLAEIKPSLEYVYTYITVVDGTVHNMMEAAMSVNVTSLLPDGGVASMISGLVGEKAVITFNVDITPGEESFPYIKGALRYNGITKEKTDTILKTIACFADDFDAASLLAQVEKPIRDVIASMNDVLSVELCSSKIDSSATSENLPEAIRLPDVFSTVKDIMFKEDDVTADEIKDVLTAVDRVNDADFEDSYFEGSGIADSYADSLDSVLDSYYVKEEFRADNFDSLFGDGGMLGSFSAENFDFDTLYRDNRSINELRPLFRTEHLGALMIEQMGKEQGIYKDLMNVRGMKIETFGGSAKLIITIEINAASLVGENTSGANLLPADKLYLRATVDTGRVRWYDKSVGTVFEGEGEPPAGYTAFYDTDVTINEMSSATFAAAMKIVKSIGGDGGALDIELRAHDIGAVIYDSFASLTDSLGGSIEFENGGVRLVSIYDYMKSSLLGEDSEATAEDIKAALQGLVSRTGEEDSEYNFYPNDIIVHDLGQGDPEISGNIVSGVTLSMDDYAFGYGLVNGFDIKQSGVTIYHTQPVINKEGNNKFVLEQLNILPYGLGSRADFINGFFGEPINDGGRKFVEFTFGMQLGDIAGASQLAGVIPQNTMYVTLLFEQNGDGGYSIVYYRINSMNERAQNALMELANINAGDIDAQIAECADALDSYRGAEFTDARDAQKAFGRIAFSVNP